MKQKVLISACLLGINCRYDQKSKKIQKIVALSDEFDFIPVCPEQLGGLSTPRPSSFFIAGNGSETIKGAKNMINDAGNDVSEAFVNGAEQTLKICKMLNIKTAILKENSPSCGKNWVYLYEKLAEGSGVTASLLMKNGIGIKSENEI